jgi:hypothetical protein
MALRDWYAITHAEACYDGRLILECETSSGASRRTTGQQGELAYTRVYSAPRRAAQWTLHPAPQLAEDRARTSVTVLSYAFAAFREWGREGGSGLEGWASHRAPNKEGRERSFCHAP